MSDGITRIGAIYQDVYAKGFLEGLKERLGCTAELIPPPGHVGKTRNMTRKQARNAWMYLQNRADIVVRLTDADGLRWQDVNHGEQEAFPEATKSVLVCGTAVNNTEDWLALDTGRLAKELGVEKADIQASPERSSVIKAAVVRSRRDDESVANVVKRLVQNAPPSVFKRWLQEPSLNDFYCECRRIATSMQCDTPNEL